MAGAAPSEENIQQFIAFSSAGRDAAIQYLSGANNDVERAVNDYFNTGGEKYLNQSTYDESAWSRNKEGSWDNSNVPAFQIDYADNAHYPTSAAPTRPPSRVSQNSSTKGIPGSPLLAGSTWGQESGVIGGAGTQFGPANSEKYYDNSSWAMTWTGAQTATDAYSDPIPAKRKRKPSQPAFLKPLGSGDYLPSLITVLHSIPLGRLALGVNGTVQGGYRQNDDWWHGDTTSFGRVVSLDPDAEIVDHGKDLLEETQKLMAFLDLTTRSYGSADTLVQSKVLEEENVGCEAKTICDRFLLAWEAHVQRLVPGLISSSLFKSQSSGRESADSKEVLNHFCTLDLTLSNTSSGNPSTLYEELDETIWGNDADGKTDVQQYISEVAPILCIRVKQPDNKAHNLNFKVPMMWYADRYMQKHEQIAKRMRQETAQQRLALQQIDDRKQQATTFTTAAGKRMDIQEMLKVAKTAFDAQPKLEIDDDGEPEIGMEDAANRYELLVPEPRPDVVDKLEAIARNVEHKLGRLDQEKEKIRAAIERGRSLLTEPSNEPAKAQPEHRYNLCGFATNAQTTYVLKRAKEQLIEMSEDEPELDQWWKLHYPTGDDPKIEKERIAADAVLDLASSWTRDILLVYATNEALKDVQIEWPKSLQEMIATDNRAFATELAHYEASTLAELPGAAHEDIPDLVPWVQDDTDEPPAYSSSGFVPDDGKLSDRDFAKMGMLDRAREMQERSDVEKAVVESSRAHQSGPSSFESESRIIGAGGEDGSGRSLSKLRGVGTENDGMMEDIDLEQADEGRVQHLEHAGAERKGG